MKRNDKCLFCLGDYVLITFTENRKPETENRNHSLPQMSPMGQGFPGLRQ
jgi:hypothetical protein